jgi:hypothetical protein
MGFGDGLHGVPHCVELGQSRHDALRFSGQLSDAGRVVGHRAECIGGHDLGDHVVSADIDRYQTQWRAPRQPTD